MLASTSTAFQSALLWQILIFFFYREGEWGGAEAERELQAGSTPSTKPNVGPHLRTLRS